jgi:elongation factor P
MPAEENRFIHPLVPGPDPTRTQQPESGKSTVQFLYKNGENFVMMDDVTYEQMEFTEAQVGSPSKFLKEGLEGITLTYLAGFCLRIEIPAIVQLQVAQLMRHIDASCGEVLTTAILETGAEVTVPSDIEVGQVVRIATESGAILGIVEPQIAIDL